MMTNYVTIERDLFDKYFNNRGDQIIIEDYFDPKTNRELFFENSYKATQNFYDNLETDIISSRPIKSKTLINNILDNFLIQVKSTFILFFEELMKLNIDVHTHKQPSEFSLFDNKEIITYITVLKLDKLVNYLNKELETCSRYDSMIILHSIYPMEIDLDTSKVTTCILRINRITK